MSPMQRKKRRAFQLRMVMAKFCTLQTIHHQKTAIIPSAQLKRKLQRIKDENADSKGIGASVNAGEFDDAISKQEAKHRSLESVNLVEHTQMESIFENFFKHAPSSMHLQAYNYFQHYLSKRIISLILTLTLTCREEDTRVKWKERQFVKLEQNSYSSDQ
jgi:hypothetical protein